MEFVERDIPQAKPGEVLVKIEYVGVCGSDLHYFESGRIGNFIVKPPFVLGHETSGIVVETGSGVTGLKPGDRVALEPGKTCGHCEYCRKGLYNLCPDVEIFATPPYDGVFQEYVAHEADPCFKLPDNVSMISGALIEPLAVGFHAVNQVGAHAGQTAMITGSGCIGLVTMLALKCMGVTEIYVSDIEQKRLDKALELGATKVNNFHFHNFFSLKPGFFLLKPVFFVVQAAGGYRFLISPHSFFQVNPVQTEVLYSKALEYAKLTGNETVFDLYSGSGTISHKSLLLTSLVWKIYFRRYRLFFYAKKYNVLENI